MLLVPEEPDLPDPSLLPLLVPRSLVQQGLAEQEQLGADAIDELLILLTRLDLNFFQFDLREAGEERTQNHDETQHINREWWGQ